MTGAFQRHIRGVGSNAYAGRNKFDTSEKHPSHDMTPECQSKNSRNRTFFWLVAETARQPVLLRDHRP
jgi:hypothetical protein